MNSENVLSGELKPVMFARSDESELDSHILFNLSNAERYMDNWYVELTSPTGESVELGPFTSSQESIPADEIIQIGGAGVYQVEMKGRSRAGLDFTRKTTLELQDVEVVENHILRFSMLYEFDRSATPSAYKNYLVESIAQLIPENARVIINGHTDIIGDEEHNYNLSLQRARSAKLLIEEALANLGINDVEFEVYGFGKLTEHAPFMNRLPEERFYNRTVIIDILPR